MICELSSSGAGEAVSLAHEARSQAHVPFGKAKFCIQNEAGEVWGIFHKKSHFDGAGAKVRHQIAP
jgi:hypothetical protein